MSNNQLKYTLFMGIITIIFICINPIHEKCRGIGKKLH